MHKYYLSCLLLLFACKYKNDKVKPSNLSTEAIYKGGIDGGVWIDTILLKNDCMRVSVYSEYGDSITTFNYVFENPNRAAEIVAKISVYDGAKMNFVDDEKAPLPCN